MLRDKDDESKPHAQVGGCGASAAPENDLFNDVGFCKSDFAKLTARCAEQWPDADLTGLADGCSVRDVYTRIAKSARMAAWLRDGGEKAKQQEARVTQPSASNSYTGCSLQSDMQFIAFLSAWLKAERPDKTDLRIERTTPVSDVVGNRVDAFRAHVAKKWSDAVVTPAMMSGTVAQLMQKLSTASNAFMRWDIDNAPRGG